MAASMDSTPSLTPSPSCSPSPTPPMQPDHFYSPDGDVHPVPSSSRAWLSPDDDPLATKGIPVFKPTMEEFQDFEAYMTRVECWGMHSGIVKIIAPSEWTDALPSTRPQLASVMIKSPIEQHMLGHAGVFRQQNIVRRKAVSIREWVELCAKEDYRAPAVDEVGLKSAGEHVPRVKRRNRRREATIAREEQVLVKEEANDEAHPQDVMHELATSVPPADADSDVEAEGIGQAIPDHHLASEASPGRKRRFPTRQEREAAAAKRSELDAAFLESFDPHTAWLPRNTSASDYTPSFCSTLERRYWRNCGLGKPPWYGADTAGTLFTDETKAWNVGSLLSALSRLLPKNQAGLPGVNTPYLYFGMWRATFAWHVEDMDLFSINYIHWGAPKFWYAIPQMRAMQLENTLRSFFPRDGSKCRQFLRHKSFLASPTLLAQSGCKPNTLVQHAGEFVITYPHGYHAGFNLGMNCAESVNFALESWIDIGRKAHVCGCVGDSVRIDVDALLRAREEGLERIAKPLSKKDNEDSSKAKSPRKRKSNEVVERKTKKRKSDRPEAEVDTGVDASPSSSETRQKIMLKLPKDPGPYPCCLCISRDTIDLLHVHDPPNPWSGCQNVPPKDPSSREIWRAHKTCAMVVPETWVDEEMNEDGQLEEVVFGVDAIVRDRWALKCSLCQKPRARSHGAPIQCTKGKCPKAFHISCAREGGHESRIQFTELREVEKEVVFNEPLPVVPPQTSELSDDKSMLSQSDEATQREDSNEIDPSLLSTSATRVQDKEDASPIAPPHVVKTIRKTEYELLCTQHNPAVIAARRANKTDRIRNDLLALPAMSRIKLRVSSGVFEVSLLSINEERNTVEVIWDDGVRREFKWSSLVWGKTDGQTVGQKPIIPIPSEHVVSEQSLPSLNVRFTSSSVDPSAPPRASDRSLLIGRTSVPAPTQIAPYSSYANFNSGQFTYGVWSNAFYQYAPTISDIANNPIVSNTLGTQAVYPHHSYTAALQPAMASLKWTPSVTNQQIHVSTFSPASRQAMTSSTASLPPWTESSMLSSLQAQSGQSDRLPLSSGTDASSNPSWAPVSDRSSEQPASSELDSSSKLPPELARAVEELQKLSSLDAAELKDVLGSRPALRDAVKILVERQAAQTQACAQV